MEKEPKVNNSMEYFNSKQFMAILIIVICLLAVSGCAKKHIAHDHPKQPTTLDTIGKLDAIANVLGCMFDPTPCQEKSKEQKDIKSETLE